MAGIIFLDKKSEKVSEEVADGLLTYIGEVDVYVLFTSKSNQDSGRRLVVDVWLFVDKCPVVLLLPHYELQ